MRARAEARFVGKVQGVYFRAYAERFARELGVNGFAMNMPDGSVRAVFEGEKAGIEEVVRKLRTEHPYARVDSVDIRWSDCQDEFECFEVRHF
ncbi:MAG: acylphosphatase [Euryarchaeota archaeon]|nr:acylphosphatase [Euryarchaeota archaeon]